jgi:hypothetical protein
MREEGEKSNGGIKRQNERIKIIRRLHFQTGRTPERKKVKRK